MSAQFSNHWNTCHSFRLDFRPMFDGKMTSHDLGYFLLWIRDLCWISFTMDYRIIASSVCDKFGEDLTQFEVFTSQNIASCCAREVKSYLQTDLCDACMITSCIQDGDSRFEGADYSMIMNMLNVLCMRWIIIVYWIPVYNLVGKLLSWTNYVM